MFYETTIDFHADKIMNLKSDVAPQFQTPKDKLYKTTFNALCENKDKILDNIDK